MKRIGKRFNLTGFSGTGRSLCFVLAAILYLFAVSGCGRSGASTGKSGSVEVEHQAVSDPLFVDATDESGVDFVHDASGKAPYFMPRSIGSGAAMLDFDSDGRLDLYLVQNGGPRSGSNNCLFRQQPDGAFINVSQGSGLDVDGYGMGVACGDVNNDGKVDVLLTEYGGLRLFLNRTSGAAPHFVDVTAAAGLDNSAWGTSSCFVDYDRDGWLDLVVVNYVSYDPSRWCADGAGRQEFCGPDAFPGQTSRLFRNLGPGAATSSSAVGFEDATIRSGFGEHPGPGLGVLCADFDGDRWPDIFIANDGRPNHLWINQHDGTFKEEAALRGIAYNSMGKSEADMGVAIGDIDGDGNFDVFVTHLASETHTLWAQIARGSFQDRTALSGITASAWKDTAFGTVMADFDNDGWTDLALVNGRVTRATGPRPTAPHDLDPFWVPYAARDQLWMNDSKGRFRDVSADNGAFCDLACVSRGLVCGDVDGDGGVDLLVTCIDGPARLYRNAAASRGHWLLVRAIDPRLQRDAYGAEIYVQKGSRRWMRWINPGYSYLCSNDPRAHFGLGDAQQYDSISVVWPDGAQETFAGGRTDRVVTLRRGDGRRDEERDAAQ